MHMQDKEIDGLLLASSLEFSASTGPFTLLSPGLNLKAGESQRRCERPRCLVMFGICVRLVHHLLSFICHPLLEPTAHSADAPLWIAWNGCSASA